VEIEHALERHPEVAEAAVVGLKSDLAGEAAAAFVVRRPGSAVSEMELRGFCRQLLPAFKAGTITFVDALPRLEYDQGFLVKLGDGAADVKPIAGLYKTQVYALARHLGVIEEILRREPTTDTSSLDQTQQDFYYSLHHSRLDLILWAKNHGRSAEEVAAELGYTPDQVRRVYDDIDQKRRATAPLHAAPILLEAVDELPGIAPAPLRPGSERPLGAHEVSQR
jgi:NAD+ synthase